MNDDAVRTQTVVKETPKKRTVQVWKTLRMVGRTYSDGKPELNFTTPHHAARLPRLDS